jgi:hypothetical protein
MAVSSGIDPLDLVLGDVVPYREHKILALIHLLAEQGVELGLSPVPGVKR